MTDKKSDAPTDLITLTEVARLMGYDRAAQIAFPASYGMFGENYGTKRYPMYSRKAVSRGMYRASLPCKRDASRARRRSGRDIGARTRRK